MEVNYTAKVCLYIKDIHDNSTTDKNSLAY